MKRVLSMTFAVVIGAVVVAGAQGQYSPPINRPTVSPYLNLLNRSNGPALNYYNLVRPQLEFRSAIGQLQRQSAVTQEEVRDTASGLITGHPTYFFSYGSYFAGGPGSGPAQGLGVGIPRPGQAAQQPAARGRR